MNKEKSRSGKIFDRILTIAIVLLVLVLLCRIFIITPVTVKMTSMYPTLEEGNVVWINKLAHVERGEIVVYYNQPVPVKNLYMFFTSLFPNDSKGDTYLLVKRVVAVAGDKVWAQINPLTGNFQLRVVDGQGNEIDVVNSYTKDGQPIDYIEKEFSQDLCTYLRQRGHVSQNRALVIEEGFIFAVGDNRTNSADSRNTGPIALSEVVGIAVGIN